MDVLAVDGQRLPLRGGSAVLGDEVQPEKNVTLGKDEEFMAFTYGVRKVNVLAPILASPRKPEASPDPNP
jgi:hypothetical protein